MRIYKYLLQITDRQNISMPKGAKVLSVKVQNEQPVLYAIVDEHELFESRSFQIFGTGHECSAAGKYIGTFQALNGSFVGHLFEAGV